jgi:hypothetical protein
MASLAEARESARRRYGDQLGLSEGGIIEVLPPFDGG